MFFLSPRICQKLAGKRSPVTETEIVQCFANQTHEPLCDDREAHATNPPTRWFVAETDYGRKLKVVYVPRGNGIYIKSAYDANSKYIRIYNENARRL